ncbi:hypothetical protein EPR50_G00104550 [Perca flavescens]|uniref:Phorbol-ester/DAG-type domain-containing protein n=1 Tax=Perca flavescens TaxID=8167 RepID=A0A484CWS3_PERFV|nr:hypothetical protein EPR50_G00104550 [Perca flavescens]
MADSGWARPADPDAADSRTASPLTGKKRAQQSPGVRPKHQSFAPGHCLKKVTLTKPTFCHSCSDFIWGLIGFLCEVPVGIEPPILHVELQVTLNKVSPSVDFTKKNTLFG